MTVLHEIARRTRVADAPNCTTLYQGSNTLY
jgi:hypothetical protein